MKAVLYYISVAVLFVLNKLPFCVLYLFSDILYYFVYYVLRYRREVVRKNLVGSFPEKDLNEIKKIERKFYSSLCDYFVETVKYYGMSEKEVRRRMVITGIDDINRMLAQGHSCVCYMKHFFN